MGSVSGGENPENDKSTSAAAGLREGRLRLHSRRTVAFYNERFQPISNLCGGENTCLSLV